MTPLPPPGPVEHDDRYGWMLCFWGEACDFTIPFRSWLDQIALRLDAAIALPVRTAGEDFVEGSLAFDGQTLAVYYEFSLGYLSLAHASKAVMTVTHQRLLGACSAA
ncbi:hypothetical protein [Caulobacter endophyticus]|uniref:hypothetical protein n=1 Tax=Caulobacter endophyticus TaxID=2172652 RepID=UPI002410663D|nr:hypothetical protein [Caulobacter endophyticus]MDG2528663.1 hypothetical protein [Caulobacter endophyticus]